MRLYGIIYYAQNLINDKIYIGQTINSLTKRKIGHYNEAKRNKSNYYFHSALRKYKNWEWNVLQFAYYKEELNALEKYWIWVLNSMVPNGYNLKEGGANGKHNKESIKKMSRAMKGRKCPHTKEWDKKISNANKGRKLTKEHCKILSETHKGIKLSEETKKKMSEVHKGINKGKKLSKEHCKKLSEAKIGTHRTEETKRKISIALKGKMTWMKGRHHTKEAKRRIGKIVKCIENGKIYHTIKEASIGLNVHSGNISEVLNNRRKTAGGYHWQFVKLE